jgi:hypothetical protein
MIIIKLDNGGEWWQYDTGSVFWYLNNKLHREDGPAKESFDGTKEWWLNGEKIPCKSQEEFERLLKLKGF